MLHELKLENFRLFKSLDLKGLKQVNLFAGKNNSGKTALLEALRIWSAQGDSTVINHIIATRGQFTPGWGESYESLFYRPALASQRKEQLLEAKIGTISIVRILSDNHRPYCSLQIQGQGVSKIALILMPLQIIQTTQQYSFPLEEKPTFHWANYGIK